MRKAAGTLLICNDTGRFLLIKRGRFGAEPGTWAVVGGSIDDGEEPIDAAKRELEEETMITPEMVEFSFFEKQNFKGTDFYLFLGYCDTELECSLNDENDDWGWFDLKNLPSPLFPTTFTTLQRVI